MITRGCQCLRSFLQPGLFLSEKYGAGGEGGLPDRRGTPQIQMRNLFFTVTGIPVYGQSVPRKAEGAADGAIHVQGWILYGQRPHKRLMEYYEVRNVSNV